jgi:hypothetical protein
VADIREALFAVATELETAAETAKLPANSGVDRLGIIVLSLGRISSIVRTTLALEPLEMNGDTTVISFDAISVGLMSALRSAMKGLESTLTAEENGVADKPGVKERGARGLLSAWLMTERLLASEPLRSSKID